MIWLMTRTGRRQGAVSLFRYHLVSCNQPFGVSRCIHTLGHVHAIARWYVIYRIWEPELHNGTPALVISDCAHAFGRRNVHATCSSVLHPAFDAVAMLGAIRSGRFPPSYYPPDEPCSYRRLPWSTLGPSLEVNVGGTHSFSSGQKSTWSLA